MQILTLKDERFGSSVTDCVGWNLFGWDSFSFQGKHFPYTSSYDLTLAVSTLR